MRIRMQSLPTSTQGAIAAVRTALHDDCAGLEDLHDLGHDGLEQGVECAVIGAILGWVDG